MTASDRSDPNTLPSPAVSERRRRWVPVLLVLVILAADFVFGAVATLMFLRHRALARLDPVQAAAIDASRLRTMLDLDDRQAEQVKMAFRTRHAAMLDSVRDQLDQLEREVDEVLNDRQKPQWHARFSRFRERWLLQQAGQEQKVGGIP